MIETPRKTNGGTVHHMKRRYDKTKETEREKGDLIQLLHCKEAIYIQRLERELSLARCPHWKLN
jgi:hypothetical protein